MQAFVTLMYHNVTDSGDSFAHLSPSVTDYFVDQATFRDQIRELTRCAQCVDAESVERFWGAARTANTVASAASVQPGSAISQPAIQITFDDGWKGSVELAGPILDDAQCQGLLFVTTDLIGRPNFVSREDLRMLNPGTLRIGSHARTHRLLNRLNDSEISEELRVSKHVLEDLVGYEITSLSIPGGALNNRVLDLAASSGYRFVYNSRVQRNTHHSGPMHIGRVAIKRSTTMRQFHKYLAHRLWTNQVRRHVLQISKSVLGQAYQPIRSWLLGTNSAHADMVDLSSDVQPETHLPAADTDDGRLVPAVCEEHAECE